MPQIATDTVTLEYDERGSGQPLILIMGLGAQMTRWPEEFCDKLADKGFRVIRYDNRDVGLSQKMEADGPPDMAAAMQAIAAGQRPNVAYDLHDMAADAIALLGALGIAKAHVVGASMGGMIGQLVAADYPDRVLSFCSIMSTTGGRDLPPAKPEAMAILTQRGPDPSQDLEGALAFAVRAQQTIGSPAYPADVELVRQRAARDMQRSYYPVGFQRQYAAVLATGDRRAKLANITAPTVVIHGADDPLVPVEGGRDTAKHIAGAELVEIAGMGHDIPTGLYDRIVDVVARNAQRASTVQEQVA
ncbi:MAG TPA: alpha/beta hydrolase [Caulobacteraceae bacterium]|nr:alpha/beta hydrolase [Caulobacteraceae bacterium]